MYLATKCSVQAERATDRTLFYILAVEKRAGNSKPVKNRVLKSYSTLFFTLGSNSSNTLAQSFIQYKIRFIGAFTYLRTNHYFSNNNF